MTARRWGRATAQIDHEHLARYKDDVGFFGFFDTIDDPEVAKALLAKCEAWLRGKGMKTIRGPISLSINEEIGCLVEGFDEPPVFMFPYSTRYQGGLIEQAGYTKAKDLLGWKYLTGELNPRTKRAYDEIGSLPEVVSRPVSYKDNGARRGHHRRRVQRRLERQLGLRAADQVRS